MKIKEVEEHVGISVHTIRFYEEAGLIQINRSKGSKYRDFSEIDVNKLKEIKLFRSLGITMEEIRRYYAKEITLIQLMDHQQKELQAEHEDMQMKEKLCEDIKKGNVPLIPYVVDQYDGIIQHKSKFLPYENAGALLTSWGEAQYSKRKLIMLECFLFPFLWIMTANILVYTFMIPEILGFASLGNMQMMSFLLAVPIAIIMCYWNYLASIKAPGELYEFCEKGIYYVNRDTKCSYADVHKAIKSGNIQNCYDFIPYDEIKTFKVWCRTIARTPVNGANVYQVDFRIYSIHDEMILIDTGVLGTTEKNVRLTAEILKQYAHKIIDPFKILDHLGDDREVFYTYIDDIHRLREHKRVGLI